MTVVLAVGLLATRLGSLVAGAATNETWRDEFSASGTWNGSDGTQPWLGPWSEVGDDLIPSTGLIINSGTSKCPVDRCAKLTGELNPALPLALERTADLAGASGATLTFDWARKLNVTPGAEFRVQASSTGGAPWSTVWSVPLYQTDAAANNTSVDITGYISSTTAIRFEIAAGTSDSNVFFDNVEILATFGANQPPVFDQDMLDRTDAENDVISISAGATDPDAGQTLTYSATGLPSGLAINPTSGLIAGTIGYDAAASSPYSVTITVTDDGIPSLTDTDTFTWAVTETNRPPVFDQDLLSRSDPEGTTINVSSGGTDPDAGQNLVYGATGLPPGLTIAAGTGDITGTIAHDASTGSPYAVTITVTDDGVPALSDTDTFTWTVSYSNEPPALTPPTGQANGEEDTVSVAAMATDPDPGDTLSFSAVGLPPGLVMNPASGVISGTISVGAAAASPYTVIVTVTDDGVPGLADSGSFTWVVADTNQSPVFDQDLLERTDAENDVISIASGATDPDGGDTLTYSATGLPNGLGINPSTGLISGTIDFSAAVGSPYAVTITVVDDGTPELSGTDSFTWTVTETNRPPTLGSPGDQSHAEGDSVSVAVPASDSDDGQTLTFTASDLPPGLAIDPTSGVISGTITAGAGLGSPYVALVKVADDGVPLLSDTVGFTWSVAAPPTTTATTIPAPPSTTTTTPPTTVPAPPTTVPAPPSTTTTTPPTTIPGPPTTTTTVPAGPSGPPDEPAPPGAVERTTALVAGDIAVSAEGAEAAGGRTIGPARGLVVAFRSTVEALSADLLTSLGLGLVIAWLAVRGIDRRQDDDEVPAGA